MKNWLASADENIWFHILPQPTDESGRAAWLSIPMIAELYSDNQVTGAAENACDDSFWTSKIATLFTGGLCGVAYAETSAAQSASDLWREYFASHVTVRPSCKGEVAAGAAQGAMSLGGTSMMVGMLMGPAAMAVTSLIGFGVGAAVGAATGGAAAKEQCENRAA